VYIVNLTASPEINQKYIRYNEAFFKTGSIMRVEINANDLPIAKNLIIRGLPNAL
jgi:hypothetical protein